MQGKRDDLPLADVRVIEAANYLAGPFAGTILADYGADVIKIEPPDTGEPSRFRTTRKDEGALGGDPFRHWGSDKVSKKTDITFFGINKNKRSLTLNLKEDDGKQVFRDLIRDSDVLIENYRPEAAARLGIVYDDLKKVNPRLIFCSVTGFGSTGPYADKPAYDTVGQAISGLLGVLTDYSNPIPVGASFADHLAAIFASIGVLVALHQRERTGEGQFVDASMLQSLIYFQEEHIGRYFTEGEIPTTKSRVVRAQAHAFVAADQKPFVIHLSSPEKFWEKLAVAIGIAGLMEDPRFNTYMKRRQNYDTLHLVLATEFAKQPRDFWLSRLEEGGVPCAPMNTMKEVFDDPQVKHLDFLHDVEGEMKSRLAAYPVTLSKGKRKTTNPAPRLGQHTAEILESLGYTEEKVADLRRRCVV